MKARLVPLFFDSGRDEDFEIQLDILKSLLAAEADFLEPLPLGSSIPEAEAVLFPQLLGQAYRSVDIFRAIDLPVLVATSEFGILNMWDWEIVSYLKSKGINILAPYQLAQTKKICRGLGQLN